MSNIDDQAKKYLPKQQILNKMEADKERKSSILKKNSKISVEAREKGNQLYRQKNHNENLHKAVLWLYSKSIAFAPNNSEELAQGYSNRSVILMHLYRFKECLMDIERAAKFTSSDHLKVKLEARKEKCIELLNLSLNKFSLDESINQGNYKQKSLSKPTKETPLKLPPITPSQELPCASDSVALVYNETFGRHFVAAKDIKPGKIIIAEESYTCFPRNSQRYIVCSHCLQFSWDSIPCDNCPVTMYCSESCKQEAWKYYHDIECLILPHMSFIHSDTAEMVFDVAIALRLFIKAVKKEGLENVLNDAEAIDRAKENGLTLLFNEVLEHDTFRSVYNLSSIVQNTEIKDAVGDSMLSKIIDLLFEHTKIFDSKKSSSNDIDDKFSKHIKQIMHNIRHVTDVNSFVYQGFLCLCQDLDSECSCGSKRGAVVAPFSSFINHSCASNVSRLFLPKNKIVMFTTAPVKKGEQLFDSYGPSLRMDRSIRQNILLQHFYFTCKCKVCTENWPTLQQLELVVNPESEFNIILQIMTEFKKYYPNEPDNFLFDEIYSIESYDEETLEKIVRVSELIYKHCNNHVKAFFFSSSCRYHIDKAFFKLYGEDCRIPNNCYEL